jgi:hypothetical protein
MSSDGERGADAAPWYAEHPGRSILRRDDPLGGGERELVELGQRDLVHLRH